MTLSFLLEVTNQISHAIGVLIEKPFNTSWIAGSVLPVVTGSVNVKARNLLDKLNSLIAPDRRGDKKRIRHLSVVMNALTDKQQQLLEQLKKAEDDNLRHKIFVELEVIRRQREKGDKVYRATKARMESRSRAAPLFDNA